MEIKIKETNEITELTIIDPKTGCDWAADLTGNDDNIEFDGDYKVCDQETFDWWSDLIERYQAADNRKHEIIQQETEDYEGLLEHLHHCTGYDLENYPEALMDALDEWENK